MKYTCACMLIMLLCGCIAHQEKSVVPDTFFFTGEYSVATDVSSVPVFYDCSTGKTYRMRTQDTAILHAYRKHFKPGETAYCTLEGQLQDSSILHITRFLGFQSTGQCMPVLLAGLYTAGTDSLFLLPDYTFRMTSGNEFQKGRWGKTYRDEGILISGEKTIHFVINYGTKAGDNNLVLMLKYEKRNLNFLKKE